MELTPTIVDIAVFGVILFSAILAYSRGLVRETLTLITWLLAAAAAFRFFPLVEPFIREVFDRDPFTRFAALAVAFVIALFVISIVGSAISNVISNSALGGIDKGLGFLFGAARGLVLLALVWMLYEWSVGEEGRVAAVEESRGGYLVSETAAYIRENAPTEMPQFMQDALEALFGPSTVTTPTDASTVPS